MVPRVSGASPARVAALLTLSERRRRNARVRDIERMSKQVGSLSAADRALVTRLLMGTTSTSSLLDSLIDERLRRPSSVEPRVRDALQLAAFETCYLDTPSAVAVSQGVELVRMVSPRAAGLANAVLRRLASEVRPRVEAARKRCAGEAFDESDLVLVSGLPAWLVSCIVTDRGLGFARDLCLAQLEPAPVCVATNVARQDVDALESLLREGDMDPVPVPELPGSFVLGRPAPLHATKLVHHVDLVVADLSAQLVCRIAAPSEPCEVLEVGQGRGTKSVLLAAAVGAVHPTHVTGVDSVPYKVSVSAERMGRAGLSGIVTCLQLDARELASTDLPAGLDRSFGVVLVDAPCSGTGTMRRHPESPSSLTERSVSDLAALQLEILSAAASRVEPGGTLVYSTCSVLREEDEDVVATFLAGDAGRGFAVAPVVEAPACAVSSQLASLVARSQTPDGCMLTAPAQGLGDGHFCARLVRRG